MSQAVKFEIILRNLSNLEVILNLGVLEDLLKLCKLEVMLSKLGKLQRSYCSATLNDLSYAAQF